MNIDQNRNRPPLLECRNLFKSYGSACAVNGINLTVYGGRIIGLLGPNGSGKTTLIKLACGLLHPSSGEIFVKGFPVGVESKKVVSYLPECTYFNNSMKVKDTLAFFADFYSDFSVEKAKDMLQRLGIDPGAKFKTLSKGTKEKVQLIMVMSRNADIYLLDEPIGGVDPAARDYILDVILKNYNEKSTIIISTHLIADIEKILDDVIFISNGKIMLADSCENVRVQSGKSIDHMFREAFRC